jgi:hypothetical protein
MFAITVSVPLAVVAAVEYAEYEESLGIAVSLLRLVDPKRAMLKTSITITIERRDRFKPRRFFSRMNAINLTSFDKSTQSPRS